MVHRWLERPCRLRQTAESCQVPTSQQLRGLAGHLPHARSRAHQWVRQDVWGGGCFQDTGNKLLGYPALRWAANCSAEMSWSFVTAAMYAVRGETPASEAKALGNEAACTRGDDAVSVANRGGLVEAACASTFELQLQLPIVWIRTVVWIRSVLKPTGWCLDRSTCGWATSPGAMAHPGPNTVRRHALMPQRRVAVNVPYPYEVVGPVTGSVLRVIFFQNSRSPGFPLCSPPRLAAAHVEIDRPRFAQPWISLASSRPANAFQPAPFHFAIRRW